VEAVSRLLDRGVEAAERIAEGLDRRNALLEESNAMARTRYAVDQAALEATTRIEEKIGDLSRLEALIGRCERALKECNRPDLASVRAALAVLAEYRP
jgi:hypothetical protein